MYCEKCGKELQENSNFCNYCGYGVNSSIPQIPTPSESPVCTEENSPMGYIIFTIMGVIGALISFPTFISEIMYNTRRHGGIISALGMLWDDNFWVIPTVLLSSFFLILGIRKLIESKQK